MISHVIDNANSQKTTRIYPKFISRKRCASCNIRENNTSSRSKTQYSGNDRPWLCKLKLKNVTISNSGIGNVSVPPPPVLTGERCWWDYLISKRVIPENRKLRNLTTERES